MAKTAEKQVRVRIAPSPTGSFHVGTARTALFNWLFARQHKGSFIVRIEDTDVERSEKRFELEILESLRWLGLDWDEGPIEESQASKVKSQKYIGNYGPYRQSERKEIYRPHIEKLLSDGHAYYCYCTKEELEAERQALLSQGLPPKYSGHCRNVENSAPEKQPQSIRLKVAESSVEFKDLIRNKVTFDANLIGDIIIAKSVSSPFFILANTIDDELMNISHVIRGEDHLSNTPKQILLQRALGFKELIYAHVPLILGKDRSKLSKRHGETALLEYRRRGFLPDAVVSFLALIGWHPKDNQEVLTREQLVEKFEISRVQKGGAIFDQEKLDWFQREHMKRMNLEDMAGALMPMLVAQGIATTKDFLKRVLTVERGRIKHFGEFAEMASFFFKLPEYDAALLSWEKEPLSRARDILREILLKFETLENSISSQDVPSHLAEIIAREGRGAVLWPLRVALSGRTSSPNPGEIIEVIGLEEAKERLRKALQKIDEFTFTGT